MGARAVVAALARLRRRRRRRAARARAPSRARHPAQGHRHAGAQRRAARPCIHRLLAPAVHALTRLGHLSIQKTLLIVRAYATQRSKVPGCQPHH